MGKINSDTDCFFYLLFSIVLLGTSCTAEVEFPILENQFCTAIEEGRESYAERGTIHNPLDKQRQRKAVWLQRKQELSRILPKGKVVGWNVQIAHVRRQDQPVQLELKLPCYDTFLVVANISHDSDLLRQVLKVQEGQYVQVFGTLNPAPPDGPDAFQELSTTEADSMNHPKFGFHLVRLVQEVDHLEKENRPAAR